MAAYPLSGGNRERKRLVGGHAWQGGEDIPTRQVRMKTPGAGYLRLAGCDEGPRAAWMGLEQAVFFRFGGVPLRQVGYILGIPQPGNHTHRADGGKILDAGHVEIFPQVVFGGHC